MPSKTSRIEFIRKRDGRLEPFDKQRIANAVHKALAAADTKADAKKIADAVVRILENRFADAVPSIENVQNVVVFALRQNGLRKVAAVYEKYRQQRRTLREGTTGKITMKDPNLGLNAMIVLMRRYLLRDENGKIAETPDKMFRRVANVVGKENPKSSKEFYEIMKNMEFLPNTPTLMNARTKLGQLSACFVIPVEDSLDCIFKAMHYQAKIQQSGGGTGFDFSHLRPKGDIVRSTHGVASGPVTFMGIFDEVTNVIKQGGKRRGANMGILRVDHPDIIEFITSKAEREFLNNFNISVAVTDAFMNAVAKNKEYSLINPRTERAVKRLKARVVWDLIIEYAWRTGDPGVIFIDEINRRNPTKHTGRIESTNPCGEQPLHPYESCNLGSINLVKMMRKQNRKYEIEWKKLGETVDAAVHFLDNVIDVNKYPMPEIEKTTKANRRIGLGVMGFADMLLMLGIPYNSNDALAHGEKIAKFMNERAHAKSQEIGKQRGPFRNFKGSFWQKHGWKHMRNATCITIAPTGTISIIAGCSSGIEPLFAVSFVRNVMDGTRMLEVNPIFEKTAKERGFYSEALMRKIAKTGSVQKMREVPKDVRRVFVTAPDISPEWHVRMQAVFQKYADNSVSKTINFAENCKKEDVKRAYELAHKLKCKGITVYRYGSKPEQVLTIGEDGMTEARSDFSGGCPMPLCHA